ncbi:MAG TPA: cation:dicarboxylase symporter family transporter, partial [Flavobacteriales bacterium]|nr:cation:dicarboxylase symporter family transporter [Flavobacteriales bacterium]
MLSKTNRLTLWILIAMVVGIGVGYAMHLGMDVAVRKGVAENLKILTDVFLRLVKMIIAPLVFSTLVVGIAKLGDMRTVGRVGGRALLWFISASLVSLLLGMLLVNLLKPGVGLHLEASSDVSDVVEKTGVFTLRDFIAHLFPSSMVDAMARNEVLQIVVFSVFFGMACASIGDYAKPVVKLLESVAHVILKMVGYVMNFAPLGVFGAIAAVIAIHGLGILSTYAVYIGQFYLGLAILWLLLLGAGFLLLGQRMKELMRRIVQPITIAFSTTSSEAVMPKLMEELERFGCKDKVVSFVLPLGYSFNLDGSMMYMTF